MNLKAKKARMLSGMTWGFVLLNLSAANAQTPKRLLDKLQALDAYERYYAARELAEWAKYKPEQLQAPMTARILQALNESTPATQVHLIRVLTYTHALDALPQLRQLAQASPDETVRAEALKGLGVLFDKAALTLSLEALRTETDKVKVAAIEVLRRHQAEGAFSALSELIRSPYQANEAHFLMKRAAIYAVVELYPEQALPVLLELLQSSHVYPCFYAIEALETLGNPAAIPALQSLLRDESMLLREASQRALKSLYLSDSVPSS